MHWVSGTWAWAKHRATRSTGSTGTAIYLETPRPLGSSSNSSSSASSASGGRRTRTNRPRTWSLPTNASGESGHSYSSSSSHSNSHSRSTSTSTSHSTSTSARGLYRVETYTTTLPHLYCIRCGGLRSRDYHYRHFDDPETYPSEGICSRQRTRCARAKSDPYVAGRRTASISAQGGVTDLIDICELPDNAPEMKELGMGRDMDMDMGYSRSATPVELMRTKSIG